MSSANAIQGDLHFENCNLNEDGLALLDGLHVSGDLYLNDNKIKAIPKSFARLSVAGKVYLSGNPIADAKPQSEGLDLVYEPAHGGKKR